MSVTHEVATPPFKRFDGGMEEFERQETLLQRAEGKYRPAGSD